MNLAPGCALLPDADIPQACDLFARVFGHATEPAHWVWKYQSGPRLAGINIVARDASGQLLGHVGASVFAGRMAGRDMPMAQLSDVMVDPAARSSLDSQGVYARLMRSMQQALQARFAQVFAYGFVGIRPYRLGERMGLYKNQHACRMGQWPATQRTGWRDAFCRAEAMDWSTALDAQSFERVWQRAQRRLHRPTLVRDSAYMRWRYAQHPQHRYQLWHLHSLLGPSGWAVTRCMPSGQHTLIDLLPASPHAHADAATRAALAAVGRGLQRQQPGQSITLASWLIDTPESRLLEPVIGVEFRVGEWHALAQAPVFMPGDTDVF